MGCPAWSTGRGRQSRGTRPRWMSGQHLFHLLAGSYQQKCCHTHWMRKGHSLQSLKKHACFCLSCKQKFGSLSSHAFAFHKAQRVPVVCDHMYTVCGIMYYTCQTIKSLLHSNGRCSFKVCQIFYNFALDNIFSLNSVMRLDSTFFSNPKKC